MATTSYAQRSFGYSGPGPSSHIVSSRTPSPTSQAYSPHARSYGQQPAPTSALYSDQNAYEQSTGLPDVRVTAPSRVGEELDDAYVLDDDRSVYSERMSAPQSYYSQLFQSGSRTSNQNSLYSTRSDASHESWDTANGGVRPDSNVEPFSFMEYESRPHLPRVVVSSPSDTSTNRGSFMSEGEINTSPFSVMAEPTTPPPASTQPAAGRVASAVQGARNFSRPNRPPSGHPEIHGSEQEKREVLERNQRRLAQAQARRPQLQHGSSFSSTSTSASPPRSTPTSYRLQDKEDHRQTAVANTAMQNEQAFSSLPPTSSSSLGIQAPSLNSSLSTSSTQLLRTPQESQGRVGLPSKPPALRSSTTESVYSMYSYYQLDSPGSSTPATPIHDGPNKPTTPPESKMASMPVSPPSSVGRKSPRVNQEQAITNPQTAEDYLALGISHHESDRLQESAQCFERAATLEGGCAVGMLMWGLSLRHGWGTPKDEQRAFKWLKKAAEHAVVDLQQGKNTSGRDVTKVRNLHMNDKLRHLTAFQNELVLAVYEVGQCFFQGWGVPKDKAMGVVSEFCCFAGFITLTHFTELFSDCCPTR